MLDFCSKSLGWVNGSFLTNLVKGNCTTRKWKVFSIVDLHCNHCYHHEKASKFKSFLIFGARAHAPALCIYSIAHNPEVHRNLTLIISTLSAESKKLYRHLGFYVTLQFMIMSVLPLILFISRKQCWCHFDLQ